jgi:hypothetical protein
MNPRTLRLFSIADVTLFPAFILGFIWQLQFTARWTWVIFILWIVMSFALHSDTPKTIGWRADNLGTASQYAGILIGIALAGLIVIGLALRFALGAAFASTSPHLLPPNLISWHPLWGYFAFCVLQQVALNSLVHNRMMSLVQNEWTSAALTGVIFAACHWPNPVLVPLTFIGGATLAWLFGRHRNIIPLAIGQAILGSLIFWTFPVAWHHHMRVGPGYYGG